MPGETRAIVVRADGAVELQCGHATMAAAIVVFDNGRRLYDCPEGCGLQDCRWLEHGG
jgi:hypothetical protein